MGATALLKRVRWIAGLIWSERGIKEWYLRICSWKWRMNAWVVPFQLAPGPSRSEVKYSNKVVVSILDIMEAV